MNALPKASLIEPVWIDAGYFLDTFGSDPVACGELVSLFLRVSEQQMTAMDQALKAGNWAQVSREAHALKGSLGLFGARDTVSLLEDLEEACDRAQGPAVLAFAEELERRMHAIVHDVAGLMPA